MEYHHNYLKTTFSIAEWKCVFTMHSWVLTVHSLLETINTKIQNKPKSPVHLTNFLQYDSKFPWSFFGAQKQTNKKYSSHSHITLKLSRTIKFLILQMCSRTHYISFTGTHSIAYSYRVHHQWKVPFYHLSFILHCITDYSTPRYRIVPLFVKDDSPFQPVGFIWILLQTVNSTTPRRVRTLTNVISVSLVP